VVHDPVRSSYLAVATLLLFIPTLHPWYLVLITPFLVFYPSKAWLYLHFAVVFTFPVLRVEYYTGVFQELHWLKAFEYFPFFALLISDFIKQRHVVSHFPFRHARHISVVIPALNESRNIGGALESVRNEGILETIVSDGGSSDGTVEIAGKLGAKVVESEKGRGHQISEGVNQCRGDIILILHADCRIIPGTFECIINKFKQTPQYIGGSLGMRYELKSFKNLFLSFLNNLRAKWAGISFGDQGQFFRKEALDIIGGFPDQMLMEDVELAMRLKENGAVCHISKGIMVSHRRWEEVGFCANFKKVVTLCSAYLINRRIGLGDARREGFYNRYYTVDVKT
jgi:rSAM/selenodomain-associated transferase 2